MKCRVPFMLRETVLFLQRHESLYWACFAELAYLLLVDLLRSAPAGLFPGTWGRPRDSVRVYAVLLVLLLVWGRFPSWLWPQQNVDEAQAIATALTLRRDPRFWLAVDAGSHGPLVALPLVLSGFLAGRTDFFVSRVTMLALLGGTLLLSLDACRRRLGLLTAKLAILPTAIALSLSAVFDLIAYNGEQPLIFLLALGAWLAERGAPGGPGAVAPETSRSSRYLFGSGTVFALIPWVKLQGVPLAAVACAAVVFWTRGKRARAFIAGVAFTSVAFLLYVLSIGAFPDFVEGYLRFATSYADREGRSASGILGKFLHDLPFMCGGIALSWALPKAAVLLGMTTLLEQRWRAFVRTDLWAAMLLLVASTYAIARPANPFPHYLFLFVPPILALSATLLAAGIRSERLERFTVLGYSTVAILLHAALQITGGPTCIAVHLPPKDAQLPAEAALREYSRPGDRLVVWGWMSAYHVASQLPQGVRYSDMWQLRDQKRYPRFEETFLSDFTSRRPELFLDVTSAGFTMFHDPVTQGLQRFPRIAAVIDRDYVLVADPAGHRLYVRRDRLPVPAR